MPTVTHRPRGVPPGYTNDFLFTETDSEIAELADRLDLDASAMVKPLNEMADWWRTVYAMSTTTEPANQKATLNRLAESFGQALSDYSSADPESRQRFFNDWRRAPYDWVYDALEGTPILDADGVPILRPHIDPLDEAEVEAQNTKARAELNAFIAFLARAHQAAMTAGKRIKPRSGRPRDRLSWKRLELQKKLGEVYDRLPVPASGMRRKDFISRVTRMIVDKIKKIPAASG